MFCFNLNSIFYIILQYNCEITTLLYDKIFMHIAFPNIIIKNN